MIMKRLTFLKTTVLCVALIGCSSVLAQRQARERFDPDGSFWIHGTPPNEFSDFGGINLNAKKMRHLPSPGVQLNTGKTLRFRTLTVKKESFRFTTVTVRGISYTFSGHFLRGGVFGAAALDDKTPVLEGLLTKFESGQKVAEANLKFTYFGGT
jgi:hypothetical protein